MQSTLPVRVRGVAEPFGVWKPKLRSLDPAWLGSVILEKFLASELQFSQL